MVIENRRSRNGNSRRESAAVGTRGSLVPDRQEEIPSERVVNNEAPGLSKSGRMSLLTANGASRLIKSGSKINSTDLVGTGYGVRMVGSCENVKDGGVPTSTIIRRSARKDKDMLEEIPDSGVLNNAGFDNPNPIVGDYGSRSLHSIPPTLQGVAIAPEVEVTNNFTMPAVIT